MGAQEMNVRLSCARAAAVRAHVVKGGVPKDRIVTTGWGELMPIVITPDDVADPQNRRVEVMIWAPGTKAQIPGGRAYRC
jgi:outer membrane protein OmpA-like peptidoglycan-associated protein